jgi:hypothetical protein
MTPNGPGRGIPAGSISLTGNLRAITSALIAIGAAAVLAIVFVPPLKAGTSGPGESPLPPTPPPQDP